MTTDQSRTAYQESAAGLARRALGALRGAGGTAMVSEHVSGADDPATALAAIRLLGADTFAPALLTDGVLPPTDAEAVALSFTVLPLPPHPVPAPPEGPEAAWLLAWRDWGTATLLAVLGGDAVGPLAPALPAGPPHCPDTAAPPPEPAVRPAGAPGRPGSPDDWAAWSVTMGRLSTLALPGLDGPVHDAARAAPRALARGATRAMLRRDYATASRITRWLAWLHAQGADLPLEPAPLIEHIGLMAAGDRLALDLAIARRLIEARS